MAGPVDRIPPQANGGHDRNQNHQSGENPCHCRGSAGWPVLGPHLIAQPCKGDKLADEKDAERLPEFLDHQIAGEEDALDPRAMIDLMRFDDFRNHRRGGNGCHHQSEQRQGLQRQQKHHGRPSAKIGPPAQIACGIGQESDHATRERGPDRAVALAKAAVRMADRRESAEDRDGEPDRIETQLCVAELPDIEHHIIGRCDRRRIGARDEQRAGRQRKKRRVAKGKQDVSEHRMAVRPARRRRQRQDAALLTECRRQRRQQDHGGAEQTVGGVAGCLEQAAARGIVGDQKDIIGKRDGKQAAPASRIESDSASTRCARHNRASVRRRARSTEFRTPTPICARPRH